MFLRVFQQYFGLGSKLHQHQLFNKIKLRNFINKATVKGNKKDLPT